MKEFAARLRDHPEKGKKRARDDFGHFCRVGSASPVQKLWRSSRPCFARLLAGRFYRAILLVAVLAGMVWFQA